MKNSKLGKVFGYMALTTISIGVMIFLGSHSLNFFQFTFTAADAIYSWLGLLLTSLGAVFWLGVFLWNADTTLRKAIALIMMVVSLAGEMITAVFDMQNAAVYASGFQFLPEEIKTMTEVIGYLGAFTGLMLIAYAAGDRIVEEFGDADGDGVPNYKDNDYKGKSNRPNNPPQNPPKPRQEAPRAPQQQQGTVYSLPAFLSASGINSEHAFGAFLDETETFGKAWQVLRDRESSDGYTLPMGISHKNFNELAGKVRANGNFQTAGQR